MIVVAFVVFVRLLMSGMPLLKFMMSVAELSNSSYPAYGLMNGNSVLMVSGLS